MSHPFTAHARRASVAALASLFLVACGGGGGGSDAGAPGDIAAAGGGSGNKSPGKPPSSAPNASPAPAPAGTPAKAPAVWVATEVMRVNTITAGGQAVAGMSALNVGGYAVAWISPDEGYATLYVQRYDDAGQRIGDNVPITLGLQNIYKKFVPVLTAEPLADGTIAVAYATAQPVAGEPERTRLSIYARRYGMDGTLVQADTEVSTNVVTEREETSPYTYSLTPYVANLDIEPLAYGGFAAAWQYVVPDSLKTQSATVYHRRFDDTGQPVGNVQVAGSSASSIGSVGYQMEADARGGYTMAISGSFVDLAETSVAHYPDGGSGLVLRGTGPALLVPLADGRYALLTPDRASPFLRFLDSQGRPVGEPTRGPEDTFSRLPFVARELPDGSIVTLTTVDNGVVARRIERDGALRETALKLPIPSYYVDTAVLGDGGIALAWTGDGSTPYDSDVFTSRLVDEGGNSAAFKAKRKACREAAGGLKGKQRKAAIEACLT